MKKAVARQPNNDDLRREHDFEAMKGGVQGKYYKAYREGQTPSKSTKQTEQPSFSTFC